MEGERGKGEGRGDGGLAVNNWQKMKDKDTETDEMYAVYSSSYVLVLRKKGAELKRP